MSTSVDTAAQLSLMVEPVYPTTEHLWEFQVLFLLASTWWYEFLYFTFVMGLQEYFVVVLIYIF